MSEGEQCARMSEGEQCAKMSEGEQGLVRSESAQLLEIKARECFSTDRDLSFWVSAGPTMLYGCLSRSNHAIWVSEPVQVPFIQVPFIQVPFIQALLVAGCRWEQSRALRAERSGTAPVDARPNPHITLPFNLTPPISSVLPLSPHRPLPLPSRPHECSSSPRPSLIYPYLHLGGKYTYYILPLINLPVPALAPRSLYLHCN